MATIEWSLGPNAETSTGSSLTTATSSISSGWRTRFASTATKGEPCPDCGALVGGREACQRLFEDLGLRPSEDPPSAALRRFVVDCYPVQPSRHILSRRLLAPHL